MHKGEIIQKQKDYQKKQGSYDNSRGKVSNQFNSPDHENKIKDNTKPKYNFKKS